MSLRVLFRLISGLVLLVAIAAGCGRDKVQVLPEAEEPPVRYELAWIDPQIVMGDTLFTLIRAARVDSFVVAGPDTGSAGAAQLVFQVEQPSCFVAVNLVDASGNVYLPILARNLPSGFYKLSLDGSMLTPVPGVAAPVLMRALVCGREKSVLLNPFVGR